MQDENNDLKQGWDKSKQNAQSNNQQSERGQQGTSQSYDSLNSQSGNQQSQQGQKSNGGNYIGDPSDNGLDEQYQRGNSQSDNSDNKNQQNQQNQMNSGKQQSGYDKNQP